jgi:hypothetical protein
MRIVLKAAVVLTLVASTVCAIAQTDETPAPAPHTAPPPGIIVMPPRLLPPMSVPGPQIPAGEQGTHTCPANDQILGLIG